MILFEVVVVILTIWYIRKCRFREKVKWVATVPGHPILGVALDLTDPTKTLDRMTEYLTKYNGMCYTEFMLCPTLVVSDLSFLKWFLTSNIPIHKGDIYAVLKNWLGGGLLISGGEEWRNSRKILTPAFHFTILEQFIEVFEDATQVLGDVLSAEVTSKGVVDIYPYLTRYTLDVICQTSMGVKLNIQQQSHSDYINAVAEMGKIIVERAFNPLKVYDFTYIFTSDYWKEKQYVKLLHQVSNSIIEQRRQALEDQKFPEREGGKKKMAFLDHLLQYRDEQGKPLSDAFIRHEVDTVMFAGHDTTAVALAFALYLLAKHPEVQAKARAEAREIVEGREKLTIKDIQNLNYLDLVVKETLRLYPSVPFYSRALKEDMVYQEGKILPKGLVVLIVAYTVNRNPAVYQNPDQFIPTRFLDKEPVPFSLLSFSAGPRNCIGQKFALLELKVALSKLLLRFEFVIPDSDASEPVVEAVTVLKPKNGIRIKLNKLGSSN
uniref:CYP4AY1 n=1 Tax=Ips paraconfusus TaxID=89938 RepID=A1BPR7_9CUCU|nr:CYP4AY1 [Ips paraconfusus]